MPFDVPPPPEKAVAAQVEQVREDDSDRARNNLHSEAMSLLAMRTLNQGNVDQMLIPNGWVEEKMPAGMGGIGTRNLREFHPPEDPTAKLAIFYRGLPVDDASAANLQSVLKQPEHTLSTQEIQGLKNVLRERSDPEVVSLNSAKTETINGQRVLVIEGQYKQTGSNIKEIFVSNDKSGAVQEIYFQAPANSYGKYSPMADQALKSIRWK